MASKIRSAVSVGLLAYACTKTEPDAIFYTPAFAIPAMLSLFHFPTSTIWRILSSLTIIGSALFLHFFAWTVISLQYTQGLDNYEARNLLPVAIGVALITTTRLSQDSVEKPVHYIRSGLFHYIVLISVMIITSSPKLYF